MKKTTPSFSVSFSFFHGHFARGLFASRTFHGGSWNVGRLFARGWPTFFLTCLCIRLRDSFSATAAAGAANPSLFFFFKLPHYACICCHPIDHRSLCPLSLSLSPSQYTSLLYHPRFAPHHSYPKTVNIQTYSRVLVTFLAAAYLVGFV